MNKILLCVSGSISAYKAPSIANTLRADGNEVKVVLTKSALKFITKLSFASQGFETYVDEDDFNMENVLHIELIKWSSIVYIAPLSANTLSKMANGITDNLLTSVFRAYPYHDLEKKLIIAPAMNTDMYINPLTAEHISKIKGFFKLNNNEDSFIVKEPVEKKLACNVVGVGALAPISELKNI